jgi:hypothetical protein
MENPLSGIMILWRSISNITSTKNRPTEGGNFRANDQKKVHAEPAEPQKNVKTFAFASKSAEG